MPAESYSGWQSSQWLERCSQFIRGPQLLVIKKAEVWSNLGEAVVQWNRHKKNDERQAGPATNLYYYLRLWHLILFYFLFSFICIALGSIFSETQCI